MRTKYSRLETPGDKRDMTENMKRTGGKEEIEDVNYIIQPWHVFMLIIFALYEHWDKKGSGEMLDIMYIHTLVTTLLQQLYDAYSPHVNSYDTN